MEQKVDKMSEIEKNIRTLLKQLFVRLIIVLLSLSFILIFKPGIIESILLFSLPLAAIQVITDKKIVIPKIVTIFLSTTILFLASLFAGYLGIAGFVLFFIGYLLWRIFKTRNNDLIKNGFDMIKHSKKYSEEIVNETFKKRD